MCHVNTGKSWDRPIMAADLKAVWEFYSHLSGGLVSYRFVDSVYGAITDSNSPQPIVLVAIIDLYYRHLIGAKGVYPWVALPFSALDYQSGIRLMAPIMEPFHGVFAMFSLAQRNLELLRQVLWDWGVQFVVFHDCGCFMPDRESGDVTQSALYQDINLVRSHYEALGGPVEVVPFDDAIEWQSLHLDMGLLEREAYVRMNSCLEQLPPLAQLHHSPENIRRVMERLPFGAAVRV